MKRNIKERKERTSGRNFKNVEESHREERDVMIPFTTKQLSDALLGNEEMKKKTKKKVEREKGRNRDE